MRGQQPRAVVRAAGAAGARRRRAGARLGCGRRACRRRSSCGGTGPAIACGLSCPACAAPAGPAGAGVRRTRVREWFGTPQMSVALPVSVTLLLLCRARMRAITRQCFRTVRRLETDGSDHAREAHAMLVSMMQVFEGLAAVDSAPMHGACVSDRLGWVWAPRTTLLGRHSLPFPW